MLKKILLGLSLAVSGALCAQDAVYPESGELSLQAGDYQVRVAAHRAYTISGFDYQSFPLLAKDGANGTILSLPDRSMLGSSHRSGNTAEQICKLTLQVDGTEQPVRPAQFSGREISLLKESLIGGFRFFTTLNLTAEGLTCKMRFNYEKEQPLTYFYLFVLGWHTDMTDFLQAGTTRAFSFYFPQQKMPHILPPQVLSRYKPLVVNRNSMTFMNEHVSV